MSNYVVAISGGICSGKSTAAQFFAELGVPVIDADDIAKELTQPGSPFYEKIVNEFGTEILNDDRSINRQAVAEIVFHDWEKKEWLESLLHPPITQLLFERAHFIKAPYVIVVIPLLTEIFAKQNELAKEMKKQIDRVLIIDTSTANQQARATTRKELPSDTMTQIMHQQALRSQRLNIADDVIENQDSLADLKKEVIAMHERYLKHATR